MAGLEPPPGDGTQTPSAAGADTAETGSAIAAWEARVVELRQRRDRLAEDAAAREAVRRDAENRRARAEASTLLAEERLARAERDVAALVGRERDLVEARDALRHRPRRRTRARGGRPPGARRGPRRRRCRSGSPRCGRRRGDRGWRAAAHRGCPVARRRPSRPRAAPRGRGGRPPAAARRRYAAAHGPRRLAFGGGQPVPVRHVSGMDLIECRGGRPPPAPRPARARCPERVTLLGESRSRAASAAGRARHEPPLLGHECRGVRTGASVLGVSTGGIARRGIVGHPVTASAELRGPRLPGGDRRAGLGRVAPSRGCLGAVGRDSAQRVNRRACPLHIRGQPLRLCVVPRGLAYDRLEPDGPPAVRLPRPHDAHRRPGSRPREPPPQPARADVPPRWRRPRRDRAVATSVSSRATSPARRADSARRSRTDSDAPRLTPTSLTTPSRHAGPRSSPGAGRPGRRGTPRGPEARRRGQGSGEPRRSGRGGPRRPGCRRRRPRGSPGNGVRGRLRRARPPPVRRRRARRAPRRARRPRRRRRCMRVSPRQGPLRRPAGATGRSARSSSRRRPPARRAARAIPGPLPRRAAAARPSSAGSAAARLAVDGPGPLRAAARSASAAAERPRAASRHRRWLVRSRRRPRSPTRPRQPLRASPRRTRGLARLRWLLGSPGVRRRPAAAAPSRPRPGEPRGALQSGRRSWSCACSALRSAAELCERVGELALRRA